MKTNWFMRPLLVVLTIAALATLAAACGGTSSGYGGSSSTPAAASPATSASATPTPTSTSGGDDSSTGGFKVTIADSTFSPSKVEVQAGTTVTWTNNDALPHTVTSTVTDDVDSATSGLFDSGTLQTGESFSYTFKKAGDYPYECTIHASMASMHGKVEVK